jgi:hypothetical protein
VAGGDVGVVAIHRAGQLRDGHAERGGPQFVGVGPGPDRDADHPSAVGARVLHDEPVHPPPVITPEDSRLEPPMVSEPSTSSTEAPAEDASRAAASPATPEPDHRHVVVVSLSDLPDDG